MRLLPCLLLASLLAAAPATAGEVIRYETADGGVGFTDDPGLVPVGAEVVGHGVPEGRLTRIEEHGTLHVWRTPEEAPRSGDEAARRADRPDREPRAPLAPERVREVEREWGVLPGWDLPPHRWHRPHRPGRDRPRRRPRRPHPPPRVEEPPIRMTRPPAEGVTRPPAEAPLRLERLRSPMDRLR